MRSFPCARVAPAIGLRNTSTQTVCVRIVALEGRETEMPETENRWQPAIILPESRWPITHFFIEEKSDRRGAVGKRIFVRDTGEKCPGDGHRLLEVSHDSARAVAKTWGRFRRPIICESQILAD